MKTIIIYGSKYGSGEAYAQALAEKLNLPLLDYRSLKDTKTYDAIICMGSLYAGGVLGLEKTLKVLSSSDIKKFFLITVGLADPNNLENRESIRNNICPKLPKSLISKTEIFHLRGSIDYEKLNLIHKVMMKFLYHSVKNSSPEKQNEETKTFIATYKQRVDYVDFKSLDKIVASYLDFLKENKC